MRKEQVELIVFTVALYCIAVIRFGFETVNEDLK